MKNTAVNDLNWDLSSLYASFDDPSLNSDIAFCQDTIKSLNSALSKIANGDPLKLYIILDNFEKVSLYVNKVVSFINLSLLADSENPGAHSYLEKSNKLSMDLGMINANLRKTILHMENLHEYIEQLPELSRFRIYLMELIRNSRLYSTLETEEIISKLQQTGSRSWQKLRDRLESSTTVKTKLFSQEEEYTLTELRLLSSSPEKNLRKKAYLEELNLCASLEIPMAACINGIKGEGITTTRMRGYDSVLDWMLGINKISTSTLDIMIRKIEEYLPLFQKHLVKRARLLGYSSGLPWYELAAPLKTNSLLLSFEESMSLMINVFKKADPDMGNFYEYVINNKWVDFPPKKGKSGGALCADIPLISQNRIHMNFNGTISDIRMLAHELGHAYHSRCLDEYPVIMRDPPTPLCETASIFSEIVLQEGLWNMVSEEDRALLIDVSTRESTQTIVDIYSRFIFEKELFDRRNDHELMPAELCEIMADAQRRAYGDSLDPEFLHPYMWIPKVHYYIPDFHYYNFPYIFGLLLSKGLYSDFKLNPEGFMSRYNNLLKSSCFGSVEEILHNSGFDITQPDFWDGAFRELACDLENFDRLI